MGQKFIVSVSKYNPEFPNQFLSPDWDTWGMCYEDALSIYESILNGIDADGESWFRGNNFDAFCYFSHRIVPLPIRVELRVDLSLDVRLAVENKRIGLIASEVIDKDNVTAMMFCNCL